ncbi:hypothetical protein HYC85_024244 [Camellia sinensis]|uniref:Uncharacterized protein n=1 Tax=Camellia sinensis TaxID=4442 RepID=A0A7J7GB71_CAMSI|nr:hypothetical protein HYC85_024244 [Camellia sinensis]
MAADMETMKRRIKGKEVATGEGRKGNTPPRHSEDRGRYTTPSQAESRSLRSGDTQSRTSRTRYSRSERTRSLRSHTEGSTYRPSHTHQTSSRQTELPRSSDLRTVLEERARQKEDARARDPRRVSAFSGWLLERMETSRLECQYRTLLTNQQIKRWQDYIARHSFWRLRTHHYPQASSSLNLPRTKGRQTLTCT